MSAANTRAPWRVNKIAAARPTPDPAPVMTATFPSIKPFISLTPNIQAAQLLVQPQPLDAALATNAAQALAAR
jgi:hypothetical protein